MERLKVKNRVFHTPLAEYLFGNEAALALSAPWKYKLTYEGRDINPGFQWPEILAAALPSVITEFSPNPPGPRLYSANQSRLSLLKTAFTANVKPYYDSLILRRDKDISALMNQKVQPSGNILATGGKFTNALKLDVTMFMLTGRKECMVEKCKTNDLAFITIIFGTLSPHHSAYVEQYSNSILSPEEMFSNMLDLGNNIFTNRSVLLQFSRNHALHRSGMTTILQLLRNRNANIMSRNSNRVFLTSLFLDRDISDSIINSQRDMSSFNSVVPQLWNVNVSKVSRIYLPYELLEGIWGLVVIDFGNETIYYLSTWDQHHDPTILDIVETVGITINNLLRCRIGSNFRDWECVLYPYSCNEASNEDSGMFIITAMYFLVQECPIYCPCDALSDLRKMFIYWLLEGKLPM